MTSTSGPCSQMLLYYQTILEKVSFSVDLFVAELRKALKELTGREADIFISWALSRFAYDIRLVRCIEYAA